jgi:hypothetical protein
MKLADLVKNTPWSSVRLSLRRLFPLDEEKWIYFKVFFDALKYDITPAKSDISIVMFKEIDPIDGEIHYKISCVNLGPRRTRNKFKDFLDRELTTWEKWLGMEIEDGTLEVFSAVEIIGVCMYMMTIAKLNPEIILDQLENINVCGIEEKKSSKEVKIGEQVYYNDLKDYFSLS